MENEKDVDVIDVLTAIHGVSERLARVETKLDKYNDVHATAYAAKNMSERNSRDIELMRDSNIWASRTAITAIVGVIGKIVYDLIMRKGSL